MARLGPIEIAVRTPASAANVQTTQPDLASSEYTVPSWLPRKIRPPATVGCAHAADAFGKPNAHFSLSPGTCAAVRPASLAGWNRVFVTSRPQPFHPGPCNGFVRGAGAAQRAAAGIGSPVLNFLPVTNSDTARRSSI